MERKINTYSDYNHEDGIELSDLIALMSANVEDAYIKSGVSYTEKDCFNKGFELARDLWLNKYMRVLFKTEY